MAPGDQQFLASQHRRVWVAGPFTEPLRPAHHVGQALAGVVLVVGHGDDGDAAPLGVLADQLLASTIIGHLVFQDADAQAVGVAAHHLGRVLDGLSSSGGRLQAHGLGFQELGMPSQFRGRALEGLTGAHRGVVEEHQEGLVLQDGGPLGREAIALHLCRPIQHRFQFFHFPVLGADQITVIQVHVFLLDSLLNPIRFT